VSSLQEWQDQIVVRLKTIPGTGVYDGGVPDYVDLPRQDGLLKPYLVVWWGGKLPAGFGYAGICGVRGHSKRVPFIVQCVGPTGAIARSVANRVRDLLEGYEPAGQGELSEDGNPNPRTPIDPSGVPVRYAIPLSFSGIVDNNLVNT